MERNDRSAPSAPRKRVGAVHRQGEVSGRKGFVKYHINAEMIRKDIDRLCAAGVPLGRITVGADCMTVVERLRAGERGCLYECIRIAAGTLCSRFARGFAAFAVRSVARYGGERMQLDGFGRRITRIYVPVDFRAHERGASPAQTFGAVGRAPQRHPARAAQALPGRSDALPEFRHERARNLRGKRSRGAQFLPLPEERRNRA